MSEAAPDRAFREVPIFSDLGQASFCFAFELVTRRVNGTKQPERTAYRLVALDRDMERDRTHLRPEEPDVQKLLVDPVRSFLDDVTNGAPGVNGRPLLFLASGAPENDPSRSVTLVRPPHWDYSYEGEVTRLHVPEPRRRTEMRLRDSICVFESGRAFYILTLAEPQTPLDEYSVIHLEQLSLDAEKAAQDGYLAFEWGGAAGLSLVDLANTRFQSLNAPNKDAPPNGIVDLMRPYGLIAGNQFHEPFGAKHLLGLCVGIEDPALLASAEHAWAKLDRERKEPVPPEPELMTARVATWERTCAGLEIMAADRHAQPDNDISRAMLAVAGMATGVPDFPYQDDSEVHDSTRSTARSVESTLFTHPRFMLEIGESWRSFREAADSIGMCPYLLMTWMVCVHDEQTVSEMEHMLEDMIYDPAGTAHKLPRDKRSRAEPLADVMQLLGSASSVLGHKTRVQQRNLERRLQLFRWESIHRTGNMFRYPKEKAALAAVRDAMGTKDRFEEVHSTLDRFENLVEDVSDLASSYAERRTNAILFVLALFGIVGAAKDMRELLLGTDENKALILEPYVWLILVGLAVLVLVPVMGNLFGKRPE